ncbi:diphthamide biosynthesis protein 2, partial [Sphaeroforma arctica JP610]
IVKHAYRVVALQFPDDMLADAQCVSDTIASGVNAQSPDTPKESGDACRVFVLGDTTYGSCCVDTVAAEHVKASLIVHYGESCQSLVTKVPVLYIYGRAEFATNMDETVKSLRENITEGSRVVVLYECKWQWRMQGLCKALAEFAHVTMSVLRSEATGEEDNATTVLGRLIPCEKSDEPHHEANRGTLDEASSSEETTDDNEGGLYNFSDTTVVWVGPQGRTLTALMLNMPSAHRFVSYNPQTHDCLLEGATVNKSLMRRYFLVEKCKQAQTVGILVGTLGIAHHNELLAHIKTILKAAGKKFYTIVIGKINGPKVANFLEVDAYVLVACAENSLVDSKEFSVPIVTPFEMELACTRGREWPGRLRTDLEEVLPQLS